jgi:hypothetical protein
LPNGTQPLSLLQRLFVSRDKNQLIDGEKQFTRFPYGPKELAINDYQLVNKAYADHSTHYIGDDWRLRADGNTLYVEYQSATDVWSPVNSWTF